MKLLVPIDGSELSLEALDHALHLARQGLKATVVLANVQEPATLYEMITLHDPEALAKLAADAGADMLAPAVAKCTSAGIPYVAEVATGDPVPMLLELREKHRCQGVLMGSHGKGLVRSSWLGSVSQAMLENCPVPVTFIKPREVP
ncbi:MAG: universal stress protein [Serpentinimonas sp.]|jgi:nucleotide-binding universal stress UspA family protein|nr:universal stress protein [Serpentinimonas sp.]